MKQIDIKYLSISVAFFLLAFLVVRGSLQHYINFQSVGNEIGFTLLSLFGGVLFLFGIKK